MLSLLNHTLLMWLTNFRVMSDCKQSFLAFFVTSSQWIHTAMPSYQVFLLCDRGGVYTRTILRKLFSKTFTLFIVSQHLHWFASYNRNGLNDYGNTGSVVIVGCGITQDKVKNHVPNTNLASFEPFCCLHEENDRCDVVLFLKYTLLLPDSKVAIFIARFRRISVNEQPKQHLFHG